MKNNHMDELASLATGLDTIFRTTCIDERAEINGRWCDVAMSVAMSEHKGDKGIGDMFTHWIPLFTHCLPIVYPLFTHWSIGYPLVTHWLPSRPLDSALGSQYQGWENFAGCGDYWAILGRIWLMVKYGEYDSEYSWMAISNLPYDILGSSKEV